MPEESPLVDIIHAYSNLASAIANQLDGQQLAQDLAQIRQVTQKECGTGQLTTACWTARSRSCF